MPFISTSRIQYLIPKALRDYFSANPSIFTDLEAQTAIIITEETGIESPADVADAPEWVTVPAAQIITYLSRNLLTARSDDHDRQIERDYREAMRFLSTKKSTDGVTGSASVSYQTGEYEW